MKDEEKVIKINDEYSIVKIPLGFRLDFLATEYHIKNTRVGKNQKVYEKYSKYYGTLYQALGGFINDYMDRYTDTVGEALLKVQEVTEIIDSLKEKVAEEWKIVKVTNG